MSKELWPTCSNIVSFMNTFDSDPIQSSGFDVSLLYRHHVPRSWVHPGQNLLVLHEELGGDPTKISVLTRTGQEICSFVSEDDPQPAVFWIPDIGFGSQSPEAQLTCEQGWRITSINFASFGSPQGNCGAFSVGTCHANILSMVQKVRKNLSLLSFMLPFGICA